MVTVGTVSRRYILRLPANYDNSHPYRLILSYHWATGSASQVFNCHTEGIDCFTTQTPFFGLWDSFGWKRDLHRAGWHQRAGPGFGFYQ